MNLIFGYLVLSYAGMGLICWMDRRAWQSMCRADKDFAIGMVVLSPVGILVAIGTAISLFLSNKEEGR